MDILTEPTPAIPGPQGFPGAYRPGIVPGAAAGQYGAPLLMPGGPIVVFTPHDDDPHSRSPLDRGSGAISGHASPNGVTIHGNADGT
jgi:hypothetical protein